MSNSWMNHKFNPEAENALVKFLKTAETQKFNPFCDMNKYEIFKGFMQMDDNLKRKVEENVDCIDLTENEEIFEINEANFGNKTLILEELHTTICEDLTASIKEHLNSSDQIPDGLLREVQKCSLQTIREIFNNLSELNNEQIILIGESVEQHFPNDLIIEYYCNCVLIRKMIMEFEEEIKSLFLRFCDKFHAKITQEVVAAINRNNELDILVLYLSSMQPGMKEQILRELLSGHECFRMKYISVIDCLLHEEIGYECLKQLIEIMAHNTDQYVMDKEYGKLLIKVTQYLGDNLAKLENPFRHILSIHKSIWKAKLQKCFDSCFDRSRLFLESQIE